jgi:hypothetical protein
MKNATKPNGSDDKKDGKVDGLTRIVRSEDVLEDIPRIQMEPYLRHLGEPAAETILNMLKERGWNAYVSAGGTPESEIARGPVEKLELHTKYVVLPSTENPNSSEEVFAKLEELALRLNRRMPTISIRGKKHAWTGFILEDQQVKLDTPEGPRITYREFINGLDSIVPLKRG